MACVFGLALLGLVHAPAAAASRPAPPSLCTPPLPPSPDAFRPYRGTITTDTLTLFAEQVPHESELPRLREGRVFEGIDCAVRLMVAVAGLDHTELSSSPLQCAHQPSLCRGPRLRGNARLALVKATVLRDAATQRLLYVALQVSASGGVPGRDGATLQREFEVHVTGIDGSGWATTRYYDRIPE